MGDVPLRPLPRIPCDTPLLDMMQLFQKGGTHMALLIQKRDKAAAKGGALLLRVVTTAAVDILCVCVCVCLCVCECNI